MGLSRLLSLFIVVAALAMGGVSPALAAPSGQLPPGEHRGLFGTVTALGADSVTLDTAQGPVTVRVDQNSEYRLPGRETFALANLHVGDRLAILASKQGEVLTALMVMVVPSQPQNQHLTGVITNIKGISITFTDRDGNTFTLDVPGNAAGLALGQLVTGIVRHDPKTGKPVARGLHQVGEIIRRLTENVRKVEKEDGQRGRDKDLERLRELLDENVTRQLSILREVLEQVPEPAKPHIRQALEYAQKAHEEALRGLGMKGPKTEVIGKITAIDMANKTVTVQPRRGDPITLKVISNSRLHKDDIERALLSDLKVGDTVLAARFDPETMEIARLVAKSPKTDEAEGILSAVNTAQSTVTILTEEKKGPLTLTVNANSQITRDGAVATPANLVVGDMVENVEFTEGTLTATRLVVLSRAKAQGVVVEFAGTMESFTDTLIAVSGQQVTTNSQTEFQGQPQVGATVKVEAVVQADGSLLALEINVSQRWGPPEAAGRVKLMGAVESFTNTQIMVSGQVVVINSQTEVEGTLQVGATIKVEGTRQADGSLLARKVEVRLPRQEDKQAELTGAIESLSPSQWVVSGKKVAIDAKTKIEVKGILQVGATAKVEGILQPDGSILAKEIEVRTPRPTPTPKGTPKPTPTATSRAPS